MSTADATAEGTEMPERNRVAWADVAKGVCILLVVLWHVLMKHYLQIDWHIGGQIKGAWGTFGEQLLPLRMPLFFAVSGFFAVRAVHRTWPEVLRTKVAKFYYLYVLWLIIHTAILAFVPDFGTESADGPLKFVAQLFITPSNLWYLYALALYFLVARATRRVPPWVVLGLAFLLSATASAELVPVPGDRAGVYQNLVFFLAGIYGKTLIEKLAAQASWLRLALIAVPYAVLLAVVALFDAKTWFGLWPLVSGVAILLGVTAAGLVTRWERLSNGLASIGRRTLPIYVIHMPVLALIHEALLKPLSSASPTIQLVTQIVEPVVLTAFVAWLCLFVYKYLPKALFELPFGLGVSRSAPPAHRRTAPASR
ncbi:acyltransferase family protein [Kribbella sp. NPDC056345]|uniref:acyltransferase family protein n=1 Tax=Kribbella sp. NPDC056345 TaxID=3345789 RepID=UPI0035D7043B